MRCPELHGVTGAVLQSSVWVVIENIEVSQVKEVDSAMEFAGAEVPGEIMLRVCIDPGRHRPGCWKIPVQR